MSDKQTDTALAKEFETFLKTELGFTKEKLQLLDKNIQAAQERNGLSVGQSRLKRLLQFKKAIDYYDKFCTEYSRAHQKWSRAVERKKPQTEEEKAKLREKTGFQKMYDRYLSIDKL